MEQKAFPFEIKAAENGTFEGYASVFGNVDSYDDVIEQGAFTKTINENKNRIKILWQHNPMKPIGVPTMMAEDTHGLHVAGKISSTTLGSDALILMRDGVVSELSIGYNTIKDEWDPIAKVRRIKELKLWEFSPVTFAANDQATISGVKNDSQFAYFLNIIAREAKAGKVLSDANRKLVEQAVAALQSLLEVTDAGKSTPLFSEADIKDITAVINEMKTYGQPKKDEIADFAAFIASLKL